MSPRMGRWTVATGGACLPAALKLCNRSSPNPVAPVCKPLLWRRLRIAWNQGPKGRQSLAGGECTHEPPELISQEPEPACRQAGPGRGDRCLKCWANLGHSLPPRRGSCFKKLGSGGSFQSPPAKFCRPFGPAHRSSLSRKTSDNLSFSRTPETTIAQL